MLCQYNNCCVIWKVKEQYRKRQHVIVTWETEEGNVSKWIHPVFNKLLYYLLLLEGLCTAINKTHSL